MHYISFSEILLYTLFSSLHNKHAQRCWLKGYTVTLYCNSTPIYSVLHMKSAKNAKLSSNLSMKFKHWFFSHSIAILHPSHPEPLETIYTVTKVCHLKSAILNSLKTKLGEKLNSTDTNRASAINRWNLKRTLCCWPPTYGPLSEKLTI